MFYLVVYKDNYADEFDLEGFKIFTQEEWDAYVKGLQKLEYPTMTYFGTNEYVEYESFEDLIRRYKVIPIDVWNKDLIVKQFDLSPYSMELGMFIEFDYVSED